MKDNYGLSEADAGKMLGAYGVWQANPANWRKGTILGLTANVNGQMSPSQDRMLRSVMGSACDQDLRERVLRGYEEAQKNGKVRIVDDPTKPQPVR